MLTLICRGWNNVEIAERCYLTINTVKSYIRTAYRNIGVERRAEAVRWGITAGLLTAPADPDEPLAA